MSVTGVTSMPGACAPRPPGTRRDAGVLPAPPPLPVWPRRAPSSPNAATSPPRSPSQRNLRIALSARGSCAPGCGGLALAPRGLALAPLECGPPSVGADQTAVRGRRRGRTKERPSRVYAQPRSGRALSRSKVLRCFQSFSELTHLCARATITTFNPHRPGQLLVIDRLMHSSGPCARARRGPSPTSTTQARGTCPADTRTLPSGARVRHTRPPTPFTLFFIFSKRKNIKVTWARCIQKAPSTRVLQWRKHFF